MVQKHPTTFITFLLFFILTITTHHIRSGLKIPIRAKRSTLSIHKRDLIRGASLTPTKLYKRGPTEINQDTMNSMSASPQRLKRRALTPEAIRAATTSAIEPMNLAGEEGKLSYLATGFNKPIEGSSKLSALTFADRTKPINTRITNPIPTSISVQKFHSTGSSWVSRSYSYRERRAYQLLVSKALASH